MIPPPSMSPENSRNVGDQSLKNRNFSILLRRDFRKFWVNRLGFVPHDSLLIFRPSTATESRRFAVVQPLELHSCRARFPPPSLRVVIVEIPNILIQAAANVIITYLMIGYYWSMYKIFWNFYAVFCTILYLSCLGMLLLSLTPHIMVASVLFSAFYTTFYLSSGFLIPKPQIPKWWMWSYSLTPASWTMEGLLTSQYGDIDPSILDNGGIAHFTIWRYRPGNTGASRKEN